MKSFFAQPMVNRAIQFSVPAAICIIATVSPNRAAADVVCNPPNQGQSGDVPFSQVTVHCEPPPQDPPCSYAGSYPVWVSTTYTAAPKISVTVAGQAFKLVNGQDVPLGNPDPKSSEVAAPGRTAAIGYSVTANPH